MTDRTDTLEEVEKVIADVIRLTDSPRSGQQARNALFELTRRLWQRCETLDMCAEIVAFILSAPVTETKDATVKYTLRSTEDRMAFDRLIGDLLCGPIKGRPNAIEQRDSALSALAEAERNFRAARDCSEGLGYQLTQALSALAEKDREIERLREAAHYVLGHHPTDPDHPAFTNTHEYGLRMLNNLLHQPPRSIKDPTP